MFAATMLVARLVLPYGTKLQQGEEFRDACSSTAIIFGYLLCYCLTTAALRPWLLKNAATALLPAIAGIFSLFAWLVPAFVGFMTSPDWASTEQPRYLLLSPFVLAARKQSQLRGLVEEVVIGWLLLALLASMPWWLGQWRRFVPLEICATSTGRGPDRSEQPRPRERWHARLAGRIRPGPKPHGSFHQPVPDRGAAGRGAVPFGGICAGLRRARPARNWAA